MSQACEKLWKICSSLRRKRGVTLSEDLPSNLSFQEVMSVLDSLVNQDNLSHEHYRDAACQAGSSPKDDIYQSELETARQEIRKAVIKIKEVELENELKGHKVEELKQKMNVLSRRILTLEMQVNEIKNCADRLVKKSRLDSRQGSNKR